MQKPSISSGLPIKFLVTFWFLGSFLSGTAFAQNKGETVYNEVQQPANPVGGLQAFSDYINQNLVYPTSVLRQGIEGTVIVSFIVEKTGSISNATIEKGLDEACNKEALRVVQKSPRWEPARHKGATVRQRVTVPIQFKISNGQSKPAATADTSKIKSSDKLVVKEVTPEQPARPEGGLDAFFKYLQEKQEYPAKARKNKIEGKVMVEFIVEKDGSLTNMKVLKKFGNGLDEEALRLIQKGPKWLPATVNGETVRQKMVLPVIFQL